MEKVYFISGTMCTIDLWQFVFPKLNNIQPIHIDITPADSFDEINKIILFKIEEPAMIVGFSLGGFSALNFAIHHPDKIKKLVIIAANTNGLSTQEINLRKSTIQFLETHSYKGISKTRIQQFSDSEHHHNEKITAIIKKMDADLGKEILLKQLKATSGRIDISSKIPTINAPVLFITAQNDKLIQSDSVKKLSKKIQKGKYINIKNCAHMIPLEKPDELAHILNSQ